MTSNNSFKELFSYTKPWRGDVYLATLYSVFNKLFDIAPEILIGVAVDLVVQKENSYIAKLGFSTIQAQVLFLGAITFIIWACESLFQYLYSIKWRNLAQNIEHKIRINLYDHVQKLHMSWHEDQTTGNITSIINDDVNQLERFLNNGANQIIQVFVSTISIGLIFFYISPVIAIVAVLPVPIIFMISFLFQKKLSPKYKKIRDKVGDLNASIFNNLVGIQTIKSFMTFSYEKVKVKKLSHSYQESNIDAIRVSSAFVPIIRMGVLGGFLGTILIGSTMALNGTLAVGSYSVLVFLTQRFLWPFTTLSTLVDEFERSMASSHRIFSLLNYKIKIYDNDNAIECANLKGDIVFKNVSFSYKNNETLFDDFNLTIPSSSSIGIVGETGAGKSTLAKLILRLYSIDNGEISIGGTSIENMLISNLRKNIGSVSQDPFWFDGSIKENIQYGSSEASDEEIFIASKNSQSREFIEKLDKGYDTLIGERGQKLSGGQKQRLSIARALVKNPDIIIFDEATSSVDNHTEKLIQNAFEDIKKNRTTIIIAHRLSTIRNCDKIYVLRNSEVHEHGTHDELIKNKNSFYANLWNIQTGK